MKIIRKIAHKLYFKHCKKEERIADAINLLSNEGTDQFKESLAKLGEDLLIKHGKPDYARITLAQLKDFSFENIPLAESHFQTFTKECEVLKESFALRRVKDELIHNAKDYLLLQASGFDANFKRGEIYGYINLFNKIEGYATQSTSQLEEEVEEVDANYPI